MSAFPEFNTIYEIILPLTLFFSGKVQKEIEDILGSSHSICFQDWKKLAYTNAVIHEIQRAKYAKLFGIIRQFVKDVNIFGFLIPKV